MRLRHIALPFVAVLAIAGSLPSAEKADDGWIALFNGKDLTGWKVRHEKYTVTKFVDAEGKVIKGGRKGKVDQKDTVVDAKNKPIEGAKVGKVSGKAALVDADGKPIPGARILKIGGRDAIVNADGKEMKDAKAIPETFANPTGGWKADNAELICGTGPHGSDIFTDQKFTDFQLHIEFLPTSNSGVYLQGLYEIQVNNDLNTKPKVVEKDGKKTEVLPNTMCGAIYGRIPPSKNMAKSPKEWQSFDVTFHGARGEAGKVTKKARVTVVWNGEKVIDNAEIDGATGSALAGKTTEPGPLLLQGDHGRVTFRNIKIKPLSK